MQFHQPKFIFNKIFNRRQFVRLFIDPILIVLMLYIVSVLHQGELRPEYIVLSVIIFALTFPGAWVQQKNWWYEIKNTLSQWFILIGILVVFGYTTAYLNQFSLKALLDWFIYTPIVLIVTHTLIGQYLSSQYYLDKIKKTAVIVGHNALAYQLSSRLQANSSYAVDLKGCFDDMDSVPDNVSSANTLPIIGSILEVPEYVKLHGIDIIYIALPASPDSKVIPLLDHLKDTTASIYFVPDFFLTDLIQARIDDIDGMPIVAVCETPFSGVNKVIKRLSDIVFSLLILLLISPCMLFIALGVRLSSPGPIIFKQRRYGLDGREIIIYKFRSMTVTEDGDQVVQATANDKRVTGFGQFIRKTSLDELPQFINVLQGRMSIVGPRPHAVTHNEIYRKLIKGYMVRHKVKPGITGWAQVNGFRGETASIDSMKSRIEYDLEYLKHWSLKLDIIIIFKTILHIFKDSKAY
jgi:putative colanic acid biosysnthesis UDP-glucose lipid carrier transferase